MGKVLCRLTGYFNQYVQGNIIIHHFSKKAVAFSVKMWYNKQVLNAPVAQLDRAIASDAMCRAFESHQAYQQKDRPFRAVLFVSHQR